MTNVATVKLKGLSSYGQSRQHNTEMLPKELHDAYEKRTWREKLHRDDEGMVIMPAMSFKNSLAEAAKFQGIQIPGKGKSTYTKHFESGVLVLKSPQILINGKPIHYQSVEGQWLNVPSNGERGSGKRVNRCFPTIPMGWETTVEYLILDDIITPEVFRDILVFCGQQIGLGTFRVRNQGTRGMFQVLEIDWKRYDFAVKAPKLVVDGEVLAA